MVWSWVGWTERLDIHWLVLGLLLCCSQHGFRSLDHVVVVAQHHFFLLLTQVNFDSRLWVTSIVVIVWGAIRAHVLTFYCRWTWSVAILWDGWCSNWRLWLMINVFTFFFIVLVRTLCVYRKSLLTCLTLSICVTGTRPWRWSFGNDTSTANFLANRWALFGTCRGLDRATIISATIHLCGLSVEIVRTYDGLSAVFFRACHAQSFFFCVVRRDLLNHSLPFASQAGLLFEQPLELQHLAAHQVVGSQRLLDLHLVAFWYPLLNDHLHVFLVPLLIRLVDLFVHNLNALF